MKCKKVLSVILACTLLSTNAPLSLFAETNNNISKNNVIQTGTYDDIGEHWAKKKFTTCKNMILSTTNGRTAVYLCPKKK